MLFYVCSAQTYACLLYVTEVFKLHLKEGGEDKIETPLYNISTKECKNVRVHIVIVCVTYNLLHIVPSLVI